MASAPLKAVSPNRLQQRRHGCRLSQFNFNPAKVKATTWVAGFLFPFYGASSLSLTPMMFRIVRYLYRLVFPIKEDKKDAAVTGAFLSTTAQSVDEAPPSLRAGGSSMENFATDGRVTSKHDGYWLVNETIYCDSDHIIGGVDLQVGELVRVVAKREKRCSGLVATRVDCSGMWNDLNDITDAEHDCVLSGCVRPQSYREEQADVTGVSEKGVLDLSTGSSCSISRCRQGYKPCKGDKVLVTTATCCKGWPIIVDVSALLEIPFQGTVTWSENARTVHFGLIVDGYILCSHSECSPGYIPCTGDRVRGVAIESNHGFCTHRALSLERLNKGGDNVSSEITDSGQHLTVDDHGIDRHDTSKAEPQSNTSITQDTMSDQRMRVTSEQRTPSISLPSAVLKPSVIQGKNVELSGTFDFGIVQKGQMASQVIWIRNTSCQRLLYYGATPVETDAGEGIVVSDPILVQANVQRSRLSAPQTASGASSGHFLGAAGAGPGHIQWCLLPGAVAYVKVSFSFKKTGILKCPIRFLFEKAAVTGVFTASITGEVQPHVSSDSVPAASTSNCSVLASGTRSQSYNLQKEAESRYKRDRNGPNSRPTFPAAQSGLRQHSNQEQRTMVRLPSSLPPYNIPDELVLCMTGGTARDLEDIVPALQQGMTTRNHQTIMSTLLYLEEIQSQIEIRKFDLYKVSLISHGSLLSLTVPGLADGLLSLSIGDAVMIYLASDPALSYEGSINQVLRDSILIKCHDQFHRQYGGEDCNVVFRLSRTTFRRCHHAVRFVNKMASSFLFPSEIPVRDPLPMVGNHFACEGRHLGNYFSKKLNQQQRAAVARILSSQCRPFPHVIFGPPGTGKTMTIVEAIMQVFSYIRGSRILVCAPSNSAADLLAQSLLTLKSWKPHDLVRLNSMRRLEEDVPDIVRPYCKAGSSELYAATHHRVVVCTCTTAGLFYGLQLSTRHFTHVFIDEAGQASEPECLVPLGIVAANADASITLAGDPRQLGAVIKSAAARHYGLHVSFIERLMSLGSYGGHHSESDAAAANSDCYNPLLVTKLIKNYRAHPILLKITSELFYDGDLEWASLAAQEAGCKLAKQLSNVLPRADCPLLFHGVRGEELREGNDPSWFNPAEVVEVVKYLKAISAYVNKSEIGIITPYRKQRERIRSMIGSVGLDSIKVGSVEEFQGQERQAVIVSTVRSCGTYNASDPVSRLDFIYCPKRFNVAVSRAEALLIVIGNPHTLVQDSMWQLFIDYCAQMGCYTGCTLPGAANDLGAASDSGVAAAHEAASP